MDCMMNGWELLNLLIQIGENPRDEFIAVIEALFRGNVIIPIGKHTFSYDIGYGQTQ